MSHQIISGNRALSYKDLQGNVLKIASGFDGLGIGVGDTMALMLRNDHAFFEASLAAGVLGAYPVPINWHYNAEETLYILNDSDAKILVIHADLLHRLKNSIPENIQIIVVKTPGEIQKAYGLDEAICSVPPESREWQAWFNAHSPWQNPPKPAPASMIYTSGTTGYPKGVRRHVPSPEMSQKTLQIRKQMWGSQRGAIVLITGPLYHSAPNAFGLTHVKAETDIVMQARFDAEEMLHLIAKHKVTHLHIVPTMFVRLLKLPEQTKGRYDISSLKFVIHGAAPCSPDVKREMMNWFGPIIHEYYGSTETGISVLSTPDDWFKHPGTVGKVCPWAKLLILGEAGEILPAGEIGDIYTVVDYQADFTYHKNEAKRFEIEQKGLVTIGDKGYLTADGYLFLCDRKNDMVISGGVNIYPAEIEKELILMPGVKDCAIFGIPDEEFGESLIAYLEPEIGSELTEEGVKQFLRGKVAGYKVPHLIKFQNNLPREDSGKIFKRKLRDPYWEKLGRLI
ncbi:MAG: AMP-binding protein [SAR324 cluster bacterium]|nr:AMP-binding protein [SAR324 cluster bacterium]